MLKSPLVLTLGPQKFLSIFFNRAGEILEIECHAKKIMAENIREFLISSYPLFEPIFMKCDVVPIIEAKVIHICEAVVEIIIGQMLSRKAANKIYKNLLKYSLNKKLPGTWYLSEDELKSLGVSSRKAKTIAILANKYNINPIYFYQWPFLSANELSIEINKQWGMADWTANMLSIFYLGHEDVFPMTDASIKRALVLAHNMICHKEELNPEKAKPYRSYLALYLWKALDRGLL